jgi:branched-chain amino acid transport system permease protein
VTEIVVSGLVAGSALALAALGISLIFGIADIANFAQGPLLAFGAMLGWWLTGVCHVPYALAFIAVVAATALLGVVIERFAVRPVMRGPRIAALLATVAAGIILSRLTELVFSPETRILADPFPRGTFELGGIRLGALELAIPAIAVGVALAVWWMLARTSLGRAMRACAQDPDAARQMGVNVERIQSAAFALSSALAGIAGMLAGTYYRNVEPAMGTQLGMAGFAAAALGGLGSLGGALAGGLALGVVQNAGVAFFGGGALQVVTFAAVLAAFALRSYRAGAGSGAPGTFFGLHGGIALTPRWTIAFAALALALPLALGNYSLRVASEVAIYATLGLSLTLVAGTCGMLSLGQVGLFAAGAYATALLETAAGWPFWLAAPAAAAFSAALGGAAVLLVVRLGGQELAIATFAIGATVVAAILNLGSFTHGPLGISSLPPPSLGAHALVSARETYVLAALTFALCAALVSRLQSSQLGLAWRAVRDDEAAAAASAVATAAAKAFAFALGGGIAGLAGSVLAAHYLYVSPDIFDANISVLALTIVVLGGMGNPLGALLGAALLIGIPEVFRPLHDYRLLAYGVALLALVRFRPQGIFAYR